MNHNQIDLDVSDRELEERRELINNPPNDITLDGIPASIVGAKMGYGLVRTRTMPMKSYEWSWDAIKRIAKRDGKFSSE